LRGLEERSKEKGEKRRSTGLNEGKEKGRHRTATERVLRAKVIQEKVPMREVIRGREKQGKM